MLHLYNLCCVTIIFIMDCFMNVWVVNPLSFLLIMFGWGIEYPSLSVCTCMFMVNPLCHYIPNMELVDNRNVIVRAFRHSMPILNTVLNKWNAIFSLIHVSSYD